MPVSTVCSGETMMSRRCRLPWTTPAVAALSSASASSAQPRQRVGDVRRSELAQRHVERVAVDERRDDERLGLLHTVVEHRAQRRMRRQPLAHAGQGRGDDRHPLRRQPDPKHLDDHRPPRRRVVATEHRAHAAGTDLVQDADTPVRGTWPVEQEAVLGQWVNSSTRTVDGVAHILARDGTPLTACVGLVDTPQGLCNSSRSVSSPSAPASAAGGLAIDIRQLPWMRRLAADYAFAFDQLAPFYAGDPRRPEAWVEVIARVHATPRAMPALSSMLRRSWPPGRRRPPRSRPPPPSNVQARSPCSPASRPGCSAGRSTRCTRRSPPSSWPARSARRTA